MGRLAHSAEQRGGYLGMAAEEQTGMTTTGARLRTSCRAVSSTQSMERIRSVICVIIRLGSLCYVCTSQTEDSISIS